MVYLGWKEEWAEQLLGQLDDPAELSAILWEWTKPGWLSEEEAEWFYDRYFDWVMEKYLGDKKDYLNEFISEDDLYDRINELDIDKEHKEAIFDYFLPPLPNKTSADYAQRRGESDIDYARRKRELDIEYAQLARERAIDLELRAARGREAGRLERLSGTARGLALNEIENATTLSSLTNNIQSALNNGFITDTEVMGLYRQHTGRLAEEAQAKAEEAQAKGAAQIQEAQEKRLEQAPLIAARVQELKNVYLPGLKQYLSDAVKAGQVSQEQADSQYALEESYIEKGYNLQDLPNYASLKGMGWIQTPEQKMAKEAQAKVDIINWEAQAPLRRQAEQEAEEKRLQGLPWLSDFMPQLQRPPIPSEIPVAEAALGATGFGEGTKLRSFIASQIGETAQKVRPERLAWWERKTTPPEPAPFGAVEGESYADVVARLQKESGRLGELLKGEGIAPTMGGPPTATGPAWAWQQQQNVINAQLAELYGMGPGGLKAIAERAYADIQKRKEEDPLAAALKKKRWWQEYTRLPGVATVPRLQRSIQFRR